MVRPSFGILILISALILTPGCRHRGEGPFPSPTASGMNPRDTIDPIAQPDSESLVGMDQFVLTSQRLGSRIRDELRRDTIPGRRPRNVLCLSGGGSYGAYSAGVLCGWSETGQRPCFDVVTGISTGALIAPLAFLGPKYDEQLRHFYTTSTNSDIFKKRLVRGILGGEAFTDTTPLRKHISEVFTDEAVSELAEAHRAGRRLMIGTTEEEGHRLILWDIGAIACKGRPCDRELIIDILLGSAAIPGAFPASKITVNIDGEFKTERHVDGGTTQALFFYPPYVPPEERSPQTLNLVDSNVYILVAGKLYADPEVISKSAVSQAGKAVSGIIYAQTRGDLQRLWTFSLLHGMNYYLTAIPADFTNLGSSGEFDPKVMTALFDTGRRAATCPQAWRTTPPMTNVAEGEATLVRQGRELTYSPRGPLIPIAAPRGKQIPPKMPDYYPHP